MDIFVDIPGLTFSIVSSIEPLTDERKAAADAKILEIISDLHNWRRSWENANQNAVSEMSLPLDDDIASSWVQDLVSRPLAANTPEQAADLLIYNSALIQLMNLQDFLQTGNRSPQPFPAHIDQAVLKGPDQPLYMPEDVKYRWQPSMEGLRLMRLASNLFTSRESSVILSASPVAIIYNSLLATEGLGRIFLSAMANPNDYAMTDRELSVFRLWKSTESTKI